MDVPFTNEEYQKLLEVVEIGEWVLLAHRPETPAELVKHREIIQKIYAFAVDHKCDENVVYDRKAKRFESFDFGEEGNTVRETIAEFEDEISRITLINQLVLRDLHETYGEDAMETLPPEKFNSEMDRLQDRYWEEIRRHGVARLRIVE